MEKQKENRIDLKEELVLNKYDFFTSKDTKSSKKEKIISCNSCSGCQSCGGST